MAAWVVFPICLLVIIYRPQLEASMGVGPVLASPAPVPAAPRKRQPLSPAAAIAPSVPQPAQGAQAGGGIAALSLLDMRSKRSCADLHRKFDGWLTTFGSVCSSAGDGSVCTEPKQSWDDAQRMCTKKGARLCTGAEVRSGAVANLSCGGTLAVWTRGGCGGSPSGAAASSHFAVAAKQAAPICGDGSAVYSAVCCADKEKREKRRKAPK